MKKKIQIAGLKVKVSWKRSRLVKSTVNLINTLNPFYKKQRPVFKSKFNEFELSPSQKLEIKLYRIFKEQFCEFFPGNKYGTHGTEPSSYIYYNGKLEDQPKKYLIGEFMFGESKEGFFKRKGILIDETIKEYRIIQNDLVLATYNKEWVEQQDVYR